MRKHEYLERGEVGISQYLIFLDVTSRADELEEDDVLRTRRRTGGILKISICKLVDSELDLISFPQEI